MIAALFVDIPGPYCISGVDPWDIKRDARQYDGYWPVVAHPPCERWGRFYRGSPRNPIKKLGDDGGCFDAARKSVQIWCGVLEHPACSKAFKWYDLPLPKRGEGWTNRDKFGGRSCCVSQAHYGHKAQKETWLYACGIIFPELVWGLKDGVEYVVSTSRGKKFMPEITKRERRETPAAFRDLLLSMARSV